MVEHLLLKIELTMLIWRAVQADFSKNPQVRKTAECWKLET
jgi:hypothetical protein